MKAKEPAAIYYSRPMVNALKRNIRTRIEQEDDAEKLSQISRILSEDSTQRSFEERYQEAKEFVFSRFPKEEAERLESHNFFIDEPFPLEIITSEEDIDRIIEEDEATDEESIPHEKVMKMLDLWGSGK